MYTQLQLIQRRVERSSARETSRKEQILAQRLVVHTVTALKPRPIIHHQSSIVRGHWGFNDGDHIVVLIAFLSSFSLHAQSCTPALLLVPPGRRQPVACGVLNQILGNAERLRTT